MRCARCRADNAPDSRFCDTCGSELAPPCPACGLTGRPGAAFCGRCGTRLQAVDAPPADRPQEGERKIVTVLFADITGSTSLIQDLDPEEAMDCLDPAVALMAEAVRRYGGTVNRIQGDGIMALFGAPTAQADHAVRACLAARRMLDTVAARCEGTLSLRVGMHSGLVVVRSLGNDVSIDLDAVGATVHVANRMETLAAPGTALMTADTARQVGHAVEVEQLGATAIRGIHRPMEIFRLGRRLEEGRRLAAPAPTPFVGRGCDMAQLVDALAEAALDGARAVALRGGPGIGKSRLVKEFLASPAAAGWRHLRSAAMPHDMDTPLAPMAGLVRDWLGTSERDAPSVVDQVLTSAAATLPEGMEAPLRALLDLPEHDPAWAALTPPERRDRMLRAVRAVLRRSARRRPTIVVVEDVQWLDGESHAVLDGLLDRPDGVPLLIVATLRPGPERAWIEHARCRTLDVAPLTDRAAESLLRALWPQEGANLPPRAALIEHAGGTPLFLEELARAMRDAPALAPDGEIRIPPTVQAVMAERIDRLPRQHRRLLQMAAVIGREVPGALLGAVAPVAADRLDPLLRDLQDRDLLLEQPGSHGQTYVFKHILTQAVAYHMTLHQHRQSMHAEVVQAMERLYAGRLDAVIERLGFHALRGGLWQRAGRYLVRAGQKAAGRSAYAEAARLLEQALDALGELPQEGEAAQLVIDANLGLRVALMATGDSARAWLCLERAAATAEALGDEGRLVGITVQKSILAGLFGRLDEALETAEAGRALADKLGDTTAAVTAAFAAGQACWFRGDLARAVAVLLPVAETAGDAAGGAGTNGSPEVLCLTSLANALSLRGATAEALRWSGRACRVAAAGGRPFDLSFAHLGRGLARLCGDDPQGAVEDLEQALAQSRRAEIRVLFPSVAGHLGVAYAAVGRHGCAEEVLKAAIGASSAQGLVAFQGWCEAALARARLHRGPAGHAGALEAAERALEIGRAHGLRPVEAYALAARGRALAATAPAAAARALDAARDLADRLGMAPREVGLPPASGGDVPPMAGDDRIVRLPLRAR